MQGIPAGRKFTIGGVSCYVVEPRHRASFQDKALLLIPDATGGGNPETQLLASGSCFIACSPLWLRCPETTAAHGLTVQRAPATQRAISLGLAVWFRCCPMPQWHA